MRLKTIKIDEGETRVLPEGKPFQIGLGWEEAVAGNKVDLDLLVIRYQQMPDGSQVLTPVNWINEELERPDLGTTKKGKPYIATPELDVIHHGDDTDGSESQNGFDELCDLDPSKAPAGTFMYVAFASNWLNPEDRDPNNPPTLGDAKDVTFGIQQEGTANRYVVDLSKTNAFDTTACLVKVALQPVNDWAISNVQGKKLQESGLTGIGSDDDLVTVLFRTILQANGPQGLINMVDPDPNDARRRITEVLGQGWEN